ncbi:MAG: hypothetical protein IJ779_01940 [Ruminococcus sp.]|nr:hypothetical protein [Ruminococcus sp.]
MKKRLISAMAAVGLALSCSPLTAGAATVADVIAKAYAVGMPEEMIQQYIAMGSGQEWTSEQCDQAIAALDSWAGQRDNAISGGDGGNSAQNGGSTAPPPVTPEEFEEMNIDEKSDYITSVPEDEKQEYLEHMSNDEKNQMLKKLDTTEQMEVIAGMLGFGDAFGYSFSIEDISDGSVMISARDESGKLVGVTLLGDTVEKTGKPYTIPVLGSCGLILASGAGIAFVLKKCR